MNRHFQFLSALLSTCALAACTNHSNSGTSVSIPIPDFGSYHAKDTSTTLTIQRLMLNVSGGQLAAPIVKIWALNQGAGSSTPPTSYSFSVSKGGSALVQVLAVLGPANSSGGNGQVFLYGDSTVVLDADSVNANINLSQISVSPQSNGAISGRWLDTVGSGPTALVNVKVLPPNAPAMIVEQTEIHGGWFSFIAFPGLKFTYSLDNGIDLISNFDVGSPGPLLAGTMQNMQVSVPAGYEYNGSSFQPVNAVSLLLGFFGPAGSSARVCYDNSNNDSLGQVFTTTAVASPVPWSASVAPTAAQAGIVSGGVGVTSGTTCPGTLDLNSLYFDQTIFQDPHQTFNFRGPFLLNSGNAVSVSSTTSGLNISYQLLPGTDGVGRINGVGLFTRVLPAAPSNNGNVDYQYDDGVACNRLTDPSYLLQPFTFVANYPLVSTGTQNIVVSGYDTTAFASGRTQVILCPYTNARPGVYFTSAAVFTGGGSSSATLTPTTPTNISLTSTTSSAAVSSCAGPFTVQTLNSAGSAIPTTAAVVANLTASIAGTQFFTTSTCSTAVSSISIPTGVSGAQFYLQSPASGSLTVAASASGLIGSTLTLPITTMGFIGTSSATVLSWFTNALSPVASRQNGLQGIASLHIESSGQYLYAADVFNHRINKFDYINHAYVGWMGLYTNDANGYSVLNDKVTGSTLATPSSTTCANATLNSPLPGWCLGGQSTYSFLVTTGSLLNPRGMADDGTYLFVVSAVSGAPGTISRYNLLTGAFSGWIGQISATPTGTGTGNTAVCTSTSSGVTPGWCMGGSNLTSGTFTGDGGGSFYQPGPMTSAMDGSTRYLYVGAQGAIERFNATTGAFAGWIGWVATAPTGGVTGCTSASVGTVTPGWCTGGSFTAVTASSSFGGVNVPTAVSVIGSTLYVLHTDGGGVITTYNLSTGAYINHLSTTTMLNPQAMTTDGNSLFIADNTRVIRLDTTGSLTGWIGKVSSVPSASGAGNAAACSSQFANSITPGWCLGGSSKAGAEEQAYVLTNAIVYDAAGGLLVAGSGYSVGGGNSIFTTSELSPSIKKVTASSGTFVGSLGFQSNALNAWSANSSDVAQYQGFDDYSMAQPGGSYSDGTYLYVLEYQAGRIKKLVASTGQLVGWLGAIVTSPTGGQTGCAGAAPYSVAPGWCTGALPQSFNQTATMVGYNTAGFIYSPVAITGDGTYIYVVEQVSNRIQKIRASDGLYIGWIGRVSSTPTAGSAGCTSVAPGVITPGWCIGGFSSSGTGDGMLTSPSAITYSAGQLYVVDGGNGRVSRYNASTGAFAGWIGRIATAPTAGCTTGTNASGSTVSINGWCTGGTSQVGGSCPSPDAGGAFSADSSRGGITTDGTYLYISNPQNQRIDKWSLTGTFVGGTSQLQLQGTNTSTQGWITTASGLQGLGSTNCLNLTHGLFTDGTSLYGVAREQGPTNASSVFKMNLATGLMVGWKGAILPGYSPTSGDPGCAGATGVTPGWCSGGHVGLGLTLGGFYAAEGVGGDPGNGGYIYVSDENTHRVTRLPK